MTIKSNPALWLGELPARIEAGVDCLKVPWRDRSARQVRDIVRVYRRAMDVIQGSDHPRSDALCQRTGDSPRALGVRSAASATTGSFPKLKKIPAAPSSPPYKETSLV